MTKPPSRLGKGLTAILGTRALPAADPADPTASSRPAARDEPRVTAPSAGVSLEAREHEPGGPRVLLVRVERISPNPSQPRSVFDDAALQELADSIRLKGVLQPILVRTRPEGRFELIAGERRWRAAQRAGLAEVPVIVRDLDDADAVEVALIENLQREDLSPLERAHAYQQYLDQFQVSADELARRLGESRSNVTNYLRIGRLRAELQALIADGRLGMGQARAVAGISDSQRQLAIAMLAVRRNLSVRQVEDLARKAADAALEARAQPAERGGTGAADRHMAEVERALSKALGVPVTLSPARRKNAGTITIRYASLEEFDRIAGRLGLKDWLAGD